MNQAQDLLRTHPYIDKTAVRIRLGIACLAAVVATGVFTVASRLLFGQPFVRHFAGSIPGAALSAIMLWSPIGYSLAGRFRSSREQVMYLARLYAAEVAAVLALLAGLRALHYL